MYNHDIIKRQSEFDNKSVGSKWRIAKISVKVNSIILILMSNPHWRFMMSWLPLQAKITLFSFVLLLTSLWSYFILNIRVLEVSGESLK
jgi:hypothetical protein